MATLYGVLPLVHLSTITVQGQLDPATSYRILIDEDFQDIIIGNVLNIIRNKGLYGVVISAQLTDRYNDYLFANYTRKFKETLDREGYMTFITIDPGIQSGENVLLYKLYNTVLNYNYHTICRMVFILYILCYLLFYRQYLQHILYIHHS